MCRCNRRVCAGEEEIGRRVVLWARCGWWMLSAMEVVNAKMKVKVKMKVDTRRYGIRDPAGRRAPRNLLPRAPRLREFYFANGPKGDGALFRRHLLSSRFILRCCERCNTSANTAHAAPTPMPPAFRPRADHDLTCPPPAATRSMARTAARSRLYRSVTHRDAPCRVLLPAHSGQRAACCGRTAVCTHRRGSNGYTAHRPA